MLHRLYTEDKNQPEVKTAIEKTVESFTLINGQGYYRGDPEDSLIIEIIGPKNLENPITDLAKRIKQINDQESVLYQQLENRQKSI